MEENTNLEESFFDLHISENIQWALNQAAKWAKLIAFFASGIVLLLLLIVVFSLQRERAIEPRVFIAAVVGFLVVFVVIGVIIGLLFNFSAKIKSGLLQQDVEVIEKGMASLKIYFIIAGILYTIFIIVFIVNLVVRIRNGSSYGE